MNSSCVLGATIDSQLGILSNKIVDVLGIGIDIIRPSVAGNSSIKVILSFLLLLDRYKEHLRGVNTLAVENVVRLSEPLASSQKKQPRGMMWTDRLSAVR